jgi:hypothetical protein
VKLGIVDEGFILPSDLRYARQELLDEIECGLETLSGTYTEEVSSSQRDYPRRLPTPTSSTPPTSPRRDSHTRSPPPSS